MIVGAYNAKELRSMLFECAELGAEDCVNLDADVR